MTPEEESWRDHEDEILKGLRRDDPTLPLLGAILGLVLMGLGWMVWESRSDSTATKPVDSVVFVDSTRRLELQPATIVDHKTGMEYRIVFVDGTPLILQQKVASR
jgi:hypothetical protein